MKHVVNENSLQMIGLDEVMFNVLNKSEKTQNTCHFTRERAEYSLPS